jgi:hypothetical protein
MRQAAMCSTQFESHISVTKRGPRVAIVLLGLISCGICSLFGESPISIRRPESKAETSVGEFASGGALAEIRIDTTPGRSISPTFMGIAHEWGDGQAIMGSSATGVNQLYRNLLKGLTAYGSGPMIVRIGGNSTDTLQEPSASTIEPFAELARALGVQFYLGVNLGSSNQQLAIDQAQAFTHQMPPGSLAALEIGNEPDSYADKHLRGASFRFEDFRSQFGLWRQQILSHVPAGTRVLGPSWAYPASLSNIDSFLNAEHSYLYGVSQHFYVADACQGHVNPPDILLRPNSSTGAAARIQGGVAAAHRYGLPFRVDELNSIACGGQSGVSDAFGSALWAIDLMFEYANIGVDGVNWQSPNGAPYSVFDFGIDMKKQPRTYWLKSARPLYYGMLFFQAATGRHGKLLSVSTSTSANIKGWATLDEGGTIRLAVLNKDLSASGTVRVVLPNFRTASIQRLTAASIGARNGLTFGGQTLDSSPDGTLRGARRAESISATSGTFDIDCPSGSAFLAEFRN